MVASKYRWGAVAVAVAVAVLAPAHVAAGQSQLSLASSSPRIEEAPMTFTASGVAPDADSSGESADYLTGAVLPQNLPCPPAPGDGDEIGGSVLHTFTSFPAGPFDITYRFTTGKGDLVAGPYRHCAYLVDRATGATNVSAQEDFTVRKPVVRARILKLPRHMRFFYDTIGRPTAHLTFVVQASSEVAGRRLLLGFRRAGRPCTGDPDANEFGGVDRPPRVTPGPPRAYRLHPELIMHPGPFPYGRRIRVCAFVAYYEESHDSYLPEGQAQTAMSIRR